MSLDHISSDPEKKFEKVIAVLLRSTIMSKWELVAILHLLQVMERSNSSKTFDKSSIQSPLQKSMGVVDLTFLHNPGIKHSTTASENRDVFVITSNRVPQ